MAQYACLRPCLSDVSQTDAGGHLFPRWIPCIYIVSCLQSYIRFHLLSELWTHVVALFQGYVSISLSPLAPDGTPLEGLQTWFITCSVCPLPAQLITFKPSGTAPLCWRHCPGWGLARLLAPTLVIPWQTLASGFYYRLRKIRRAYWHMTLESGHPKHLCPLWRVFDLTKQELQQRRSQPFKSSSLAIPPSWTVAWPCSQLNDLDRTHQIFFQSDFQKYQWFKTFLEPCRPLST